VRLTHVKFKGGTAECILFLRKGGRSGFIFQEKRKETEPCPEGREEKKSRYRKPLLAGKIASSEEKEKEKKRLSHCTEKEGRELGVPPIRRPLMKSLDQEALPEEEGVGKKKPTSPADSKGGEEGGTAT